MIYSWKCCKDRNRHKNISKGVANLGWFISKTSTATSSPRKGEAAQISAPSPTLQNYHVPAFIPPFSNPILELSPHKFSGNCGSLCIQTCTGGLDGRDWLRSRPVIFNPFLSLPLSEQVGLFFYPVLNPTTRWTAFYCKHNQLLSQLNYLLLRSAFNSQILDNWGIYFIVKKESHGQHMPLFQLQINLPHRFAAVNK